MVHTTHAEVMQLKEITLALMQLTKQTIQNTLASTNNLDPDQAANIISKLTYAIEKHAFMLKNIPQIECENTESDELGMKVTIPYLQMAVRNLAKCGFHIRKIDPRPKTDPNYTFSEEEMNKVIKCTEIPVHTENLHIPEYRYVFGETKPQDWGIEVDTQKQKQLYTNYESQNQCTIT